MKAWRALQAIRNKRVDKEHRWGKQQAKRMAQLFVHGEARPSPVLMDLLMPFMPVMLEGPTQDGKPLTGNLWELEK